MIPPMNRSFALLPLLLGVLCLACPKKGPTTTVAGTDDEQMDQYSAQLEEYAATTRAGELPCGDWQKMAGPVCDLSSRICEVAGRTTDRDDFQKKCIGSQEECARFNEHANSCRK